MPAQFIGAHMPTGKGLASAVRHGVEIGCTAMQVFTSSPQMWRAKAVDDQMARAFKEAVHESGMGPVFSHDSYLVNLCAINEEIAEKSLNSLKGEMNRCATYGISYVVSHLGACVGQETEVALKRVARAAQEVLEETDESVILLAETTAGQGSSLDSRFEELARLIELMGNPPRLGICVDTCHIFAAGYDIRTPETYAATFAEFDRLVGTDKIKVFHCNDSKHPLGSRKDRHEHIGEGHIGPEAFRCLVNDPRFEQVPMLVETPEAEDGGHAKNVATLQSLRV
jgi:deoxyribonuclease-4